MKGDNKINRKMKALRALYQLTQAQLAQKVGCTQTTVVFVERGITTPNVDLAKRFAKALNTTVEELF